MRVNLRARAEREREGVRTGVEVVSGKREVGSVKVRTESTTSSSSSKELESMAESPITIIRMTSAYSVVCVTER